MSLQKTGGISNVEYLKYPEVLTPSGFNEPFSTASVSVMPDACPVRVSEILKTEFGINKNVVKVSATIIFLKYFLIIF